MTSMAKWMEPVWGDSKTYGSRKGGEKEVRTMRIPEETQYDDSDQLASN